MTIMDSGEWDPSGRYNELRWQWRILMLDTVLLIAVAVGVVPEATTKLVERSSQLRKRLGLM